MIKKLSAEAIGTFWLVFGGCGSAVVAAGFPELGIGFAGVALAFGLTVLTMAYAVGPISGGHFNPAVTLGCAVAGRCEWSDVLPYWIAQIAGGTLAALALYIIASGTLDWTPGAFASNGFGEFSPAGTASVGVARRGHPDRRVHLRDPRGDPARRTSGLRADRDRALPDADPSGRDPGEQHLGQSGPLDGGGVLRRDPALMQLWVFWLAPLAGAVLGALLWTKVLDND